LPKFPDVNDTPRKEYTEMRSSLRVTVRVYGEPNEQSIETFNRIYNDLLDKREKMEQATPA
jgi:hypothetical protein